MSTALYLLRCKQLGLSFEEMDELSEGDVWDMMTELANDQYKYPIVADAAQIEAF